MKNSGGIVARRKKVARPRPIVTGYLEKVSSAIFDRYRKAITDMTMGQQGLYALYRKNKLYYLGLAGNLRNRVSHHLEDRHQQMAGGFGKSEITMVNSSDSRSLEIKEIKKPILLNNIYLSFNFAKLYT